MDITGNIIAVMPAQSGVSQRTGNTWMRQEYVLEVPGQWPRHICFGIFGEDRIKQFNLHQGEQNITVQFDIDAHEHEGRWYNEIRAYNVIRSYAGQPAPQQAPYGGQPAPAAPQQANPFPPQQPPQPKQDDLPF
ncbi:MAG: DUF3127 domain-containing protein [Prevotella sp.]|nr:DUF3127 domain-containing protein [Prevotella sp.]